MNMADPLGPHPPKRPKLCIGETPSLSSENSDYNLGPLELPDDLMQGYEGGQQSTPTDLQTPPVHPSGHHDNASLQALLARSTPTSQHMMAASINTMASGHPSVTAGAMAAAGLNVNALKGPMANSLNAPPHNVSMNKAANAVPSHMVGAGDGHPGFPMGGNIGGNMNMMNNMGLKQMGPNPMMGGIPGMPGMPQPHHQMMNGPAFPHNMGQVRGMAPTTMNSVQTLPPMGQNTMMGNGQMPTMPGHQMQMDQVMNMQQNQVQMTRPPSQPMACGTGPRQPGTDPDKSKLIQQQLVLLLHAHKCQRREVANGEQACGLPYCRTMKNVLTHMTTCTKGKTCDVAHCASSRQIITHWKNCARADCPVCLPLKHASNQPGTTVSQSQTSVLPPQATNQAQNSSESMRLANDTQTSRQPANINSTIPNAGSAVSSQPGQLQTSTTAAANQMPSASSASTTSSVQQMMPNMASNPPPNLPGNPNHLNTPGNQEPNQPGTRKEWHSLVTQDLRNRSVHKLVLALFPTPDAAALRDPRMKNLVAFARKVEGDMFETANDRGEYYHLLVEKIYKIQKELEEKRIQRMRGQNTAGGMAAPA